MKLYNIFILLTSLTFLTSCDEEEKPPAYFHFSNISFENNPNADLNQGSLRQEIPNAYVLIRDESSSEPAGDLGFQNIPATFPYLGSGSSTITIMPAVRLAGSSTSIVEYPHFEPIVFENYDVKSLEVDTLPLVTRYKSSDQIEFLFNEDFEANMNIFRDYAVAGTEGRFENQNQTVYEGGQSGRIHLDAEHPTIDVATSDFYPITTNRPYLEIDINTAFAVGIGVVGKRADGSTDVADVGGLFSTGGEWKKGYFPLTDAISYLQTRGSDSYQVFFRSGAAGFTGEADIFIDNVKLIQQK